MRSSRSAFLPILAISLVGGVTGCLTPPPAADSLAPPERLLARCSCATLVIAERSELAELPAPASSRCSVALAAELGGGFGLRFIGDRCRLESPGPAPGHADR